jgi:hypothetical protein
MAIVEAVDYIEGRNATAPSISKPRPWTQIDAFFSCG